MRSPTPEKLIPTLVRKALAGDPLPVYGDGLHIRDWIWVDDQCRGILAAAESGAAGSVYNLGGRCERTNLAVAKGILALLGRPESLIRHVDDRPGHDRRYAIDPSRAEAEFGWRAEVGFDEALESTVRWYMRRGGHPTAGNDIA